MTQIEWRRLAWLLLRTDAKGIRNFGSQAAGSLLGPVLLLFVGSMPLALLFVFLRDTAGAFAVVAIVAGSLPWALLAAFGPPRWPGAAHVMVPLLPTDDRAIYAHSVLRILLAATVGTAFASLIVFVFLLVFETDLALPFMAGTVGLALAYATAASLGRLAWGLVASQSARAQLTARLVIAGVCALPGVLLLADAPALLVANSMAPFLWLADLGISAYPEPTLWTPLAMAAMVAVIVGCAVAPIRSMPPRATPAARALAITEIGATLQRTTVPRSSPMMRRPMAPYRIPRGADRALRYLARQWLKMFWWILISFGVLALTIFLVFALVVVAPPQGILPFVEPQQILGTAYIVTIFAASVSSFPGLAEWTRAPSRKTDADRFAIPAALRVGPPILILKRWAYLQTLPLNRKTMEGAFLRPLLVMLALFLGGVLALTAATSAPLLVRFVPWFLVAGSTCVFLGSMFVGRRSSSRHARQDEPRLNAMHTLGAALWMAACVPLWIVGTVGTISFLSPFGAPPGAIAGFALFAAAAILMPVVAYRFARERLVAVERAWESPDRPVWLAGGAVAFCAMPIALIAFWISLAL